MLVITLFLFTRIPGGFLPIEDQGTVLTAVQAPPGATRERTEEAVAQVKAFYRAQEIVVKTFILRGLSFFGQGQANAMMRSEQRRVGKECVIPFRSRWSLYHSKKQ